MVDEDLPRFVGLDIARPCYRILESIIGIRRILNDPRGLAIDRRHAWLAVERGPTFEYANFMTTLGQERRSNHASWPIAANHNIEIVLCHRFLAWIVCLN
jgi:hypothetical protein